MDRAAVAEWILCCVVNSSRAEKLIGDLLEVNPRAHYLKFWMFVGWHVIAISWRTALGMICGGLLGLWSWVPIITLWQRVVHTPPSLVMIWLMGLSMLLWCLSAFSVVRFGWRSQMVHLSTLAALLATSAATLLQLPGGKVVVFLATVALVGFNVQSRKRCKIFAIFLASVAAAWVMGSGLLQLQDAVHPFSKWPLLLGVVLIPFTEGWVASKLYERLRAMSQHDATGISA